MPQAKMCKNCNRLVKIEIKSCPSCGENDFELVELNPFERVK